MSVVIWTVAISVGALFLAINAATSLLMSV